VNQSLTPCVNVALVPSVQVTRKRLRRLVAVDRAAEQAEPRVPPRRQRGGAARDRARRGGGADAQRHAAGGDRPAELARRVRRAASSAAMRVAASERERSLPG
jgi:hypothetical protein